MTEANPPAGAAPKRDDAPVQTASDNPAPVIRRGLGAILAFVLVFIVGGALTPLDAAVIGQGHVGIAGNRQSVQHRDGGIVASLNVREGQTVRAGEVLVEIDATELKTRERVLARQVIAFQMREARLATELEDQRSFPIPAWVSQLPEDDQADARGAHQAQLKEFEARTVSLGAQNAILGEKIAQLEASIGGLTGEIASTREQKLLAEDQLADIRSLNQRGYAPLSRVRGLESTVAELGGRILSLEAQQTRERRTITEFAEQRRELRATRLDAAAQELREVQTELLVLEPQLEDTRAQIGRAEVRATATGEVVGLSVFTVGGVVAPGQLLMDIVPERAGLVIEAMIRPQDSQNVRIGQAAEVRLSIPHGRRAPRLMGTVTAVSADQLVDETTGQPYFQIQAELSADEISRAQKAMGADVRIGPGAPAEVVIPVRGRTALGYFLDPIGDALWRGMREE